MKKSKQGGKGKEKKERNSYITDIFFISIDFIKFVNI